MFNQDTISIHNVKSGISKSDVKIALRTGGLPTALKGHGNRGAIVLLAGRAPASGVCMMSTSADSISTVSTDGLNKIQKINELCNENKSFIVKDKLYNIMYNKDVYFAAYHKFKSKPGNMTPGIVPTTLDGISDEVIMKIISNLRDDSFKFNPDRRVYIPKSNGGERPLTIAPPRDKLVQEVMRMILEAIYEPAFQKHNHGFRPNKSCHTALKDIRQKFGMAK